ncbi:MAG: histidinol-phosphatase HisJ family protein [Acetivibrionales bacterium]
MFDCHVHSNFSFDSNLKPEAACDKAIELGLDGIAFVDHLDLDFPDSQVNYTIDFDVYSKYMDSLCLKYKKQLEVLKGIEVGIQPHVIESTSSLINKYDFDFIIASVHIIDGLDPYTYSYYQDKTKLQVYSRYLQEILFMIENYDDFDVTGHFNFIIRCAVYKDNSMKYNDLKDLFDSIFKLLISKGKGFEVNTGSFREKSNRKNIPDYDINILKRYKELGGEIVCLGSDAHRIEHIGYKFDYFKDMISSAGFKYLTHFVRREPVFTKI